MHLIHNGSVGQGSPIENQIEDQKEAEVAVVEVEEAEDFQEQQETQMIEIMAQS